MVPVESIQVLCTASTELETDLQFSPLVLARSTLLNFINDGKIFNLPLYAISLLAKLVFPVSH